MEGWSCGWKSSRRFVALGHPPTRGKEKERCWSEAEPLTGRGEVERGCVAQAVPPS